MTEEAREKWNHNNHFHPVLLDALPAGARTALDVGCGEGLLCRQLRAAGVASVTGIDLDKSSIELARSYDDGNSYVVGDALTYDFTPASFDAVFSVATIHHFDFREGLQRFKALVKPGGVIAISSFAKPSWPWTAPVDLWGFARANVENLYRKEWQHSSPIVWPPPMSQRECKRIALEELPGADYKPRMWLRYTLLWRKPA